MSETITLSVNGASHDVVTEPTRSLLSVLRDDLDLTGSKYGCGEGACGACTVLLNDRPVHSCVLPVSYAAGKRITTIEGLSTGGNLHPVQRAFLNQEALQCGYCTPGMIMAAAGLLKQNPHPDDAAIRAAMQGNICRCGTYPRIVRAIHEAAGTLETGT